MHFGQNFLNSAAQHAILNLKVILIKGQLQFIELEHAVLLLWIKRWIMSGVKWSIFGRGLYSDRYTLPP